MTDIADEAGLAAADKRLGPMLLAVQLHEGLPIHPADVEFHATEVVDSLPDWIWVKYPLLAAVRDSMRTQYIAAATEVLTRFQTDKTYIGRRLSGPAPEVETLELGLGDAHRGSRTVVKLMLRDGQYLYYKPRGGQGAHALEQLQERVGLSTPAIVLPTTIAMDDHIWQMPLAFQAPTSASEVGDYWHNAGVATAILDVVQFGDGHQENVLCHGLRLGVLDDETLFSARGHPESGGLEERSILDTLLLRKHSTELQDGPIAAFTSCGSERRISATPHVRRGEDGSLGLHFTRRASRTGANLPIYSDRYWLIGSHLEPFLAGLRRGYQLVLHQRDALRDVCDSLALKEVRTRHVARPTRYYKELLCRLTLPDLATSPADALTFLTDHLMAGALQRLPEDIAVRVVRAEAVSLQVGDVPYFFLNPARRELWTEEECIVDFFPESVASQVQRFVDTDLTPSYVDRQAAIVRNQAKRFRSTVPLNAESDDGVVA